jgi:hypothetical protein
VVVVLVLLRLIEMTLQTQALPEALAFLLLSTERVRLAHLEVMVKQTHPMAGLQQPEAAALVVQREPLIPAVAVAVVQRGQFIGTAALVGRE